MSGNPVFIFGAGATKACGGPLTAEILPEAFRIRQEIEREYFNEIVDKFLIDRFHVPEDPGVRRDDDYPPLPLLLALVDTAIDKKHSFGPGWPENSLVDVRDGLEYIIFALLQHQLQGLTHNYYRDLLSTVRTQNGSAPNVISLNYDIIADNTMCHLAESEGIIGFPDYTVDISTDVYRNADKFGRLLKLHGSLNWLYCPGCQRLDIGIDESGRGMVKVLDQLYIEDPLEPRYGCHGSPCSECSANVRPVLITPTHLKDYRNPQIARVWHQADRMLRQADSAYIIGYSLPEDDVDVTYLLKRGLENVEPSNITVVEFDPDRRGLREHPVGRRYRALFGDDLDWHPEGFADFVASIP